MNAARTAFLRAVLEGYGAVLLIVAMMSMMLGAALNGDPGVDRMVLASLSCSGLAFGAAGHVRRRGR